MTANYVRRSTPIEEAADLLDRIHRHETLDEISRRSGLTLHTLWRVKNRRGGRVYARTFQALEEAAFVLGVGDWPEPPELEAAA